MLFEDNILFLVLKVLITFSGTLGMIISTTAFRFSGKKHITLLLMGSFFLYVILSTYAIIYYFDYAYFLRVFLLTISVPTVVLLCLLSDGPFTQIVFTHTTHILLSLYIAATVTLLNNALNGNELSDLLLRILIYLVVILIDFHFVRRAYLDFVNTLPNGWGLLSLIPCALILLAVTLAFYPEHYTRSISGTALVYLLAIVILVVYIAIGSYLSLQHQRLSIQQNRKILEEQVANIKKEQEHLKLLTEQTRIIRHDTRHILSTIASLAESNDMPAILSFIEHMDKVPDIPVPCHYCSNPVLDAAVSTQIKVAAQYGITFDTSISVPETLPFDSSEFALCFACALKALVKYCQTLPEPERHIQIRCISNPGLMFEIQCPCRGGIRFDRHGLPLKTKQGVSFQLRPVLAFCEKHNAYFAFTAEHGHLQITVAL